ncbi:hypothetical protein D8B26_001813 [Coccidioides posadasii str. Silveira]|uniref:DNA repair protein Rad4 n=2 Tax=Coccidioides posadasii TaxID=199306 RepID=E9CWI0_COCPS|nr:DNA repair protein Rad4 [Coccidioides posadasii str. Silveira]KMM65127.1 DNA repair protein rhp42 [Coccidioides posadasii RMSCC 3488]QVM07109.1 hypothetical protein D8B26_001813 [Coccidioides posadasii str. Silveira]
MRKRTVPPSGGRRVTQPSRTAESEAPEDDSIAEVYRDMLAEAHSTPWRHDARATKRRRVGERTAISHDSLSQPQETPQGAEKTVNKIPQTVYDIDASDESEVDEWEDVELPTTIPVQEPVLPTSESREDDAGLQITLTKPEDEGKEKASSRRKPVSGAEKKWRLDIHKVHLLCLLSHVQLRNSWCNDDEAQRKLKGMLSKNTVRCLNPKADMPQFSRSTTFADGLKQASEIFRRRFKVTAPGMRRSFWLDNLDISFDSIVSFNTEEVLTSKDAFRKQAISMEGSCDLGAQLFCAMLRAANVNARLVCSLQPLPFSGVAKGGLPVKSMKENIVLSDDNMRASSEGSSKGTFKAQETPPHRMRRLGQPRFSPGPSKSPRAKSIPETSSPSIPESSYPIFWVEAFNEAMQKWVAVDPMVTNTIGKPSRFEPPASDRHNTMSYVIAFEEDGSALDVTKRYTKSFNSKTRKSRVEYTKGGERWWHSVMDFYEKPFPEDRDQLEIGELTAKAAAEGMPRNVQDFKNHPIYALERDLRRNEVIYPRREIGKVGLSRSSTNSRNQALEAVYRRSDVHVVKSAEGWYRQGRCIKTGEQPLKRVPIPKTKLKADADGDVENSGPENSSDTPMYAIFQTEIYKPPPVVDDRVPKNAYGNIDVYVPSMVPEGAFHLKHYDGARAAKILGIDYADAVIGFQFRARHGTAVTHGIVASAEHREALLAVISGLEDERGQAEQDRRTMAALSMWRQLLIKLRIAERVQGYTFEGEEEKKDEAQELSESDYEANGGGFLPEGDEDGELPTARGVGYDDWLNEPPAGGLVVPEVSSVERPLESTSVASSSRYTLVVVPRESPSNDRRQAAFASAPHGDTAPPLAAQQPQEQGEPPPHPASPANGSHLCPSKYTPTHDRAGSVEEMSGLPDLVHNDSDSEIDDQNSMISHDPEDEDAEPEWLLSD